MTRAIVRNNTLAMIDNDASFSHPVSISRLDSKKRAVVIASMAKIKSRRKKNRTNMMKIPLAPLISQFCLLERARKKFLERLGITAQLCKHRQLEQYSNWSLWKESNNYWGIGDRLSISFNPKHMPNTYYTHKRHHEVRTLWWQLELLVHNVHCSE